MVKAIIIWKCREIDGQGKPLGKEDFKSGCGMWQSQKTGMLLKTEKDRKYWQGTCKNCGKRQRLNLGNIHQGFDSVEAANEQCQRSNNRDGYVEIIQHGNPQQELRLLPQSVELQDISPPKGEISPSNTPPSIEARRLLPVRDLAHEEDQQKVLDNWHLDWQPKTETDEYRRAKRGISEVEE